MTAAFHAPRGIWLAVAVPLLGFVAGTSVAEEATGGAGTGSGGGLPIEIEAEQGIEWLREQRIVYARGNARAIRGDLVVTADVLGARYRDLPQGGQEVYKLEADGNVKIATPSETAYADTGTYNLDTSTLLLHGSPSRMQTGEDTISARQEMEYGTKTRVLVARGDAVATQRDRVLKADTITAYLNRDDGAKSRLKQLDADRNVRVITPKEVVRGDQSTYDVATGLATITGDVKITRGGNQLNGCRGVMDTKADVSRLFACPNGNPDRQRVRGLILPGAPDQP